MTRPTGGQFKASRKESGMNTGRKATSASGAQGRAGKQPSETHHPSVVQTKNRNKKFSAPAEPHVALLTNISTRPAALHTDCLERYVNGLLAPTIEREGKGGERKSKQHQETAEDAHDEEEENLENKNENNEKPLWKVDSIAVREETRSAEISIVCVDPSASAEHSASSCAALANQLKEKIAKRSYFGRTLCVGISSVNGDDTMAELPATSLPTPRLQQSEFCTAQASTNVNCDALALKKLLMDIPGFLSCWKIRKATFRLLFDNRAALFSAKRILDEFQAEELRVSVSVPDIWVSEYHRFVEVG